MSIVGRFRRWRDRLLSDPGFQRWAASTPLIRVVARREARAAFDLASGFVYTQILTACVEVGLFEHLRAGPSPIESIARATGLDTDAAARLLEAARSLRRFSAIRERSP
jgi:demethylspheroidene O-methyltransferase